MDGSTNSFNSLGLPKNYSCDAAKADRIFTAATLSYVLQLPFFLSVFWVGHEKRKKAHSGPTTGGSSPLDTLTLHLAAMEVLGIAGACVYCCGLYVQSGNVIVQSVGSCLLNLIVLGQVSFHSLACVDRYLAVVRPIAYLRLKAKGGVRITTVCAAVTWLCGTGYVVVSSFPRFTASNLIVGCVLSCHALAITTYCSVSVVCVLIRPAPGEGGRDKRRANTSKRTAFYTIVIIQGALLVKFVGLMLFYSVFLSDVWAGDKCVLSATVACFELPGGLVLPLLYLHREGKLPKFKTKMTIQNGG